MRGSVFLGVVVVLAGCAVGTVDDGMQTPDGAVVSEDGFTVPPIPDSGPPAECIAGDSRPCEAGAGCTGLQVCIGGRYGPCDSVTELCNGLDDDCDGDTDEDFGGLGQACAAGRGVCQAVGDNICAENGRGVICGAMAAAPGVEVCNGLDDDCDGIADEEARCPDAEAACNDGVDDDGDGIADCADEDCVGSPDCAGDPEDCATPGDEDGDGRSDCDDLDCAAFEGCQAMLFEICDAPGDEDGDGDADCEDSDCADFIDCVPPPEELCDIRGDEDGDGDFDCNDADCEGHPACGPPPDEICDVRGDEDGDGDFDCLDADCAGHPACQAPTEICDQPGDEDGDARPDCADDDCVGHPACAPVDEICDRIGDEDGNGRADCADPVCVDHPFCAPDPEVCDRVGDEDGDGDADCDDADCAGHPACVPVAEICDVAGDEDGDGAADCDDADCAGHPACAPAGPEICDRIGDEDGDGDADCDDADCAGHPFCAPPVERCDVVGDEDGDGAADCDDADCAGHPACPPPVGGVSAIAAPGSALDLEGDIDAGDPLWARPTALCAADGAADHHYETFRVRNDTGAPQTLQITAAWDVDGYLHVFGDPFVPADLGGCVAGNDDFGGVLGSQIPAVPIAPGQTLTIVASTFGGGVVLGPYLIEVLTIPVRADIAAPGGQVVIEGSLDATDPLWDRPSIICDAAGPADHAYDVIELHNPTAAAATVTITAAWQDDGYLHLFGGAAPFDPANLDRCVSASDDFGTVLASQLAGVAIPAGGAVLVVASTYNAGAAIGPWSITVATD